MKYMFKLMATCAIIQLLTGIELFEMFIVMLSGIFDIVLNVLTIICQNV